MNDVENTSQILSGQDSIWQRWTKRMLQFEFKGYSFVESHVIGEDRRYIQIILKEPQAAWTTPAGILRDQDRVMDELTDIIKSHELGKRIAYNMWWINDAKSLNFLILLTK